jgi:tetratricopeptide (TPR) repeat protein
VLRPLLYGPRERFHLEPVMLSQRASGTGSLAPPDPVEELAAKVLERADPYLGSTWMTRVHIDRASLAWNRDGADAAEVCLAELRAAVQLEALSAEANYALGALEYNRYEEVPTRSAVTHFAVAHGAASRSEHPHPGLVGLALSGLALSLCQLYHRFGDETEPVLRASRTAASMAVAVTRDRVLGQPGGRRALSERGRRRSARFPLRTALEAFALARYAEAFAQHITERREDVARSIPLYESAIRALEEAEVEVPAVLFNNLGYQHLTLAGRLEPGPDAARYRTAAQLFDEAIERAPGLPFAWANRGCIQRLTAEFTAAEASYRRAILEAERAGGTYLQGENELACVLLEAGQAAAAQALHEQAVSRVASGANRAKMRAEYAQVLLLVGHPAAAKEAAELGLTDDPGSLRCRNMSTEAEAAL